LAGAVDNDRAGGHLVQGVLHENLSEIQEAEADYRTAMQVEPLAIGPRSNLAQLLDRRRTEVLAQVRQLAQARNIEAAQELLAQAGPLEDEANRLRDAELSLLERDALWVPEFAELQTRLGFLRYSQGWRKEAGRALEVAYLLDPRSENAMFALAVYFNDTSRPRDALPLVRRLRQVQPNNGEVEALEIDVQSKLRAGPAP